MRAVWTSSAMGSAATFELRCCTNGNWIVEGPGNRCGGIFVSEAAARHFVHDEERARSDASVESSMHPTSRRSKRMA